MKHSVTTANPVNQATDCLIVAVFENQQLSASAAAIDKALGGIIGSTLKAGDINGKCGEVLMFPSVKGIKPARVLLCGQGKQGNELSGNELRKVTTAVFKSLKKSRIAEVTWCLDDTKLKQHSTADTVAGIVESADYTLYTFDQLKEKKTKYRFKHLRLYCQSRSTSNAVQTGTDRGQAIANGVKLARDLGNLPGNICTPTYLADEAKKLQKSHKLKVTVLDEARMAKLGMGSFLSVSRGSREPAKLIVMEYKGGGKDDQPVALVGKGLTFDAGGISLKPAAAMDEMKYDMCGGASVFGAMVAIAEMKLPINVVGIVPSSENLPDGDANKPGDIVTSMAGKTIEILNTDAEGRLILCDALTYCRKFNPAAVIDIATLTGACVIALGAHPSGLFTKSDELSDEILAAGEQCGDRAWRMPLWDDYQSQLNSPFADMANIGGRGAGAVTAACFLARFTEDLNWAHLDIAGTAWTSGASKSSTGRPVGLLTRFVMNRAAQ
ncbi:MAG: leucyl aminopeptidase [Parasphingorhabdus sp.]|jgi:leucyl aminopeptidase